MGKAIVVIGLVFLLSGKVGAQEEEKLNFRREAPLGLSLYLGGASVYAVSLDYFVIPNLNLELNVGANFSGGIKYHFVGHKPVKWSPYVGLMANATGKLFGSNSYSTRRGFYFPIGVHYIGVKSFSFAIEAGPWYIKDDDGGNEDESGFHPWLGLKFGMRFGK